MTLQGQHLITNILGRWEDGKQRNKTNKKKIKTEKSKEKLSCLRSSRPTRILDSNIVAMVQALPCMAQQEC